MLKQPLEYAARSLRNSLLILKKQMDNLEKQRGNSESLTF